MDCFDILKLKQLITTHYNNDGTPSYKIQWDGEKVNRIPVNMLKTPLLGDGDFRSPECVELLKEADIVVTNPPFSLFREYIAQLIEYNKKFAIIGSINAIAYKEVFPLLRDNKVFLGYSSGSKSFKVDDKYNNSSTYMKDGDKYAKFGNICWFTNLDLDKTHEQLVLTKNYKGNEDRYPKYYNYDAIDCNKVADIPKDYFGKIGVPITYMAKHCPEQFQLIGIGSDVPKNKEHEAYKANGIICYEENGIPVWTTPYTIHERKIGNSLRVMKNNLPAMAPYNRIIIQRKNVN